MSSELYLILGVVVALAAVYAAGHWRGITVFFFPESAAEKKAAGAKELTGQLLDMGKALIENFKDQCAAPAKGTVAAEGAGVAAPKGANELATATMELVIKQENSLIMGCNGPLFGSLNCKFGILEQEYTTTKARDGETLGVVLKNRKKKFVEGKILNVTTPGDVVGMLTSVLSSMGRAASSSPDVEDSLPDDLENYVFFAGKGPIFSEGLIRAELPWGREDLDLTQMVVIEVAAKLDEKGLPVMFPKGTRRVEIGRHPAPTASATGDGKS